MSRKIKYLFPVCICFVFALGVLILLENRKVVTLPCILNHCPLGGTCSWFEGKTVCLDGYQNGTICNYCKSRECTVGESFPLYINCLSETQKGLGAVSWSEKLKGQFCKDKKTGKEISYQEASEIAQKNKCGLQGETLVTFSTNYLCNDNAGTLWVDLQLKPKKAGCNPACVVNIVNKTASVNWRCTGATPSN